MLAMVGELKAEISQQENNFLSNSFELIFVYKATLSQDCHHDLGMESRVWKIHFSAMFLIKIVELCIFYVSKP